MRVYLLAAVRREHRRLTVLSHQIDRSNTPPSVIRLVEDAMLSLDDAATQLEQREAVTDS